MIPSFADDWITAISNPHSHAFRHSSAGKKGRRPCARQWTHTLKLVQCLRALGQLLQLPRVATDGTAPPRWRPPPADKPINKSTKNAAELAHDSDADGGPCGSL
jgi:hypothetical protein